MEKEKRISPVYLLLCLAAAGLFVLLALRRGAGVDEAYALALVRRSFGDIWRISAAGENPPLYFYAAKLFSMPFGYEETALRLFSGLCFLIITALGGWEITRFWGRKMGLTFMVLFPLYPFGADWAAQVGANALAALWVFLSALFAYRVWKSNLAGDWIGLGAAAILAAYTHHYALASAAAIYLLLLLCALICNRKLLRGLPIALAADVLLYIPWMKSLIRQVSGMERVTASVHGAAQGAATLFHAAGNSTFPFFLGGLMLLILLGVVLRRRIVPMLAAGVCILTAGAGIALCVLRADALAPCAPLLAFLLSWGVCAIRREALFGGVMGFLLMGFAGNLLYGFLPAPAPEHEYTRAVAQSHPQAQAYVILTEDGIAAQQVIAYCLPETPIYAGETLGAANPYTNIHPMEEFVSEDWDTLLAAADPGSRPIGGFPHGFQSTPVGTYQAGGEGFDLWLLERETPGADRTESTPAE